MSDDSGPGVPEALPRVLRGVADRLGAETLDRIWIFPPIRKGRREWGLVAVSRYEDAAAAAGPREEAADAASAAAVPDAAGETAAVEAPDRRRLYTAAYTAERTGRGLSVEPVLNEEGSAPLDRLPRVMEGVVRRSGDARGEAREVALAGDPAALESLVEELEELLEELDPLSPDEPGSILEP